MDSFLNAVGFGSKKNDDKTKTITPNKRNPKFPQS